MRDDSSLEEPEANFFDPSRKILMARETTKNRKLVPIGRTTPLSYSTTHGKCIREKLTPLRALYQPQTGFPSKRAQSMLGPARKAMSILGQLGWKHITCASIRVVHLPEHHHQSKVTAKIDHGKPDVSAAEPFPWR